MSKRQASLFEYGFTKKVKHRNTLVNVFLLETMFMKREYTRALYAINPLNLHRDCLRMFTGLILLLSVLINRNLL